nr:uncharacterized protein LOC108069676 [Drosophila takahashii]
MAPTNSCYLCSAPDNEEMLRCIKCSSQYHPTCCGLDNCSTTSNWTCACCTEKAAQTFVQQGDPNLTSIQLVQEANKTPTESNQPNQSGGELSEDQRQLMLQQLQEELDVEKEFLRRKFALLRSGVTPTGIETQINQRGQECANSQLTATGIQFAENNGCSTPHQPVEPQLITTRQAAFRQMVPRELPSFSGDPKEWPIFFSSFESSTKMACYSNEENMIRLQKALKGKALDAVRDCLLFPDTLPDVMRTLRMYFGRPEHILKVVVDNMRRMPAPKGQLEPLIELAFAVKNMCATMKASNMLAHLNNPTLLQEIVEKLGPEMMLNWALYSKQFDCPNLQHLADWMFELADAACRVTTPAVGRTAERRSLRQGCLNTHTAVAGSAQQRVEHCMVCDGPHCISRCESFAGLPYAAKWDVVRTSHLCKICLKRHNKSCWKKRSCGINNCQAIHHPLLHQDQSPVPGALNNHRQPENEGEESYFRIIPVTLRGKSKLIEIYAFMDDGSTLTLLEESVANELEEDGIPSPLCISWTGSVQRQEPSSRRLDLRISGTSQNSKVFNISNVHTVASLGMTAETMIAEDVKRKYRHLKGIPIKSYKQVVPKMIIGVNNPNLISSLKVREGKWNQPVAAKTRLGWTVYGGSRQRGNRFNFHKCECDSDLHEMVKAYITAEDKVSTQRKSTPEESRASEILMERTTYDGNKYTAGLLWLDEHRSFPDSFPMAERRLKCLQRKMHNDPELAVELNQQIQNLVDKGYAKKLSSEETKKDAAGAWYLPIFTVRNPHKPNRVRLVWDAAAKASKYCLNDYLLKGPDLLVPLLRIMYNFRMRAVAISGDIAEMFHRIAVRQEDACAQRFLWCNQSGTADVYQLNVLTFGAACSPCIAHYVRDKNALKHAEEFEAAARAITKFHYVDDYIDSCDTPQQAITLAREVKEVHSRGGFHMHKWCSNHKEVVADLNGSTKQEEKEFYNNEEIHSFEKILGMQWSPSQDAFTYALRFVRLNRNIIKENIVPTKREVLQVLMSVFDPMGFVSCIMMYLKILLQNIWRTKMGWDDELPPELYVQWNLWLSYLPLISQVAIPRRYFENGTPEDCSTQLHIFVDAGEEAYAAVAYFRIQFQGIITVRLVSAKSKVAPVRPLSIPRMELQSALTGARLFRDIKAQHDIKFTETHLWTDSKTVLAWLNGDPRKYQQFVMFRLAEISELSDVNHWRWVPSKHNVADVATKRQSGPEAYDRWFAGPEFLRLPAETWPITESSHSTTEELRPRLLHIRQATIRPNYEAFSKWITLSRAVAYWFLYKEQLTSQSRKQSKPTRISVFHIRNAQAYIFRCVQIEGFPDEFARVLKSTPVARSSVLWRLQLCMNEDNIMQVRNRVGKFKSTSDDLVILPTSHWVTKLIVRHYHEKSYHINHETALNEVRQRFYIPKLRPLFKQVRRDCQQCKLDRAKPQPPIMAPLPPARLGGFQRPFTFVGIDYFGPLTVIDGRKSLKRWGMISTCLTMRAIHIEIVNSLSTDSCLMGLRNFIARRGLPHEIYSDNGTNFRGADSFLQEVQFIDESKMHHHLAQLGIEWKFNPPAAPHMGGAWERMVRSIKTVLYKISPHQKFSDESLRTAMLEIELTVNSRPLTFVSLDHDDQEALTPNHFLLGSSNGTKPFCDPERINYRWCLRQSEQFANQFWTRWVTEILPTITRRSKWHEKVKPIDVGDLVIIVDETQRRNTWLKGRVIEVTRASDGQVRRAKVQTRDGFLVRPAVKLAVLDVGPIESKLQESSLTGGGECCRNRRRLKHPSENMFAELPTLFIFILFPFAHGSSSC